MSPDGAPHTAGEAPTAAGDVLIVTFDALRFDVADQTFREGRTPFLRSLLPDGWEPRHSPGNFTFAAHAAIFAGFWPTPADDRPWERPFALRFPGGRSPGESTLRLDGDSIVEGLRRRGYRSLCVGGVGFFNKRSPLGSVFPALFDDSHWEPAFGVSERTSARDQTRWAAARVAEYGRDAPLLLFLNVSATHPPTRGYVAGARADSVETQAAALEYVDRHLPPLFEALRARGRGGRAFLMSDHGTLFGEDGRTGHRTGHPTVWTVPYGEAAWEATP